MWVGGWGEEWQGQLEGTPPRYWEGIGAGVLKPPEGGLNLAMDQETIKRLAGYGQKAGEILRGKFDLDQHRWRRFLGAMARMEEKLDDIAQAYEGGQDGAEAFATVLHRHAKFLDRAPEH